MIHKRVGAILLTLDDSYVLFSVVHNHEDISESLKYCKCFAFASCLQATVDKEKGGKSLLATIWLHSCASMAQAPIGL